MSPSSISREATAAHPSISSTSATNSVGALQANGRSTENSSDFTESDTEEEEVFDEEEATGDEEEEDYVEEESNEEEEMV
ncbi:hypothetical protein BDD12DRAFT_885558 [Trichophaea hybrida]|nr:hypothetical protein BDD12DRAFT_885558 [Trichophaea hybrida]